MREEEGERGEVERFFFDVTREKKKKASHSSFTHLRAHPRFVERRVVPVKGSTRTSLARLGQATGERGSDRRSCCESLVVLLLLLMHRRHRLLLVLLRLLLVVVASSGATSRSSEASRGVHCCGWQNQRKGRERGLVFFLFFSNEKEKKCKKKTLCFPL